METSHQALTEQAEQIVRATQLLFSAGVMSHSGHANLSVRLPGEGERMLITSSGSIRNLTADSLGVVTFDGVVIEGHFEAVAREIIGMHAAVYQARPDAAAVIHTHSPHVTTFALAHRPLPCAYEALLRFGVAEDIPVVAWAPRGSREAVGYIVEQITAHPTIPAVLLANHGLLAWGRDPLQTAMVIVAMEEAAEMTLAAQALGGPQPFPEGALEREREHMRSFQSPPAPR